MPDGWSCVAVIGNALDGQAIHSGDHDGGEYQRAEISRGTTAGRRRAARANRAEIGEIIYTSPWAKLIMPMMPYTINITDDDIRRQEPSVKPLLIFAGRMLILARSL